MLYYSYINDYFPRCNSIYPYRIRSNSSIWDEKFFEEIDKAQRIKRVMIRGNGWKGMEFGVQAGFMTVQNACIVCDFSEMRSVHLVNVIWNITKYEIWAKFTIPAFEIQESFLAPSRQPFVPFQTTQKNIFSSRFFFSLPLTRWIWFKNIFGYNAESVQQFQDNNRDIIYCTYLTMRMRIFMIHQTKNVLFLFSWNIIK